MNLRLVDLNLLVAFDALWQARHITRAGQRLGIGQPAMSATLTRLRAVFGDDLFVKQGGAMAPTARARSLAPEIRRILREVELLLSDDGAFDPRNSRRAFRLRLSDLLSLLLLPGLVRDLGAKAPTVTLEVAHLGPEATVDALERDSIELAVSMDLPVPKSIETQTLFDDRAVCVARQGHPAQGRLGELDAFLEAGHVRVAQSPLDDRFADRQLAGIDSRRRVALTVPHWLAVPAIVAASDLVAVMPESLAGRFATAQRLALIDLPLPDPAFTWALYWHRRHSGDQGLAWLRDRIVSLAGSIDGVLPATARRRRVGRQ